jgi:hypothetical protein
LVDIKAAFLSEIEAGARLARNFEGLEKLLKPRNQVILGVFPSGFLGEI